MEGCGDIVTASTSSRLCFHYLLLLLFILSPNPCTSSSDSNEVNVTQIPLDFEYHNYTMMTEFLKEIVGKYPNLTSMESIGKSVKKRELWTLMVSSLQDDSTLPLGTPNIKFIGNIHGNEAVGRELILHMIQYLVTNYEVNNTVTELLDSTRIYFLPSMNPDGFEIATELSCSGGQGRKNMRNMDLNRNFPDHFRVNKLAIQPETEAIIGWMKKVPFILSASLHGGALVANYPYENIPEDVPIGTFNYSPSPDDDVFKHLAMVYAQTHPKMHQGIQCKAKGPIFNDGITNGAAWYAITGGMQDYNYVWHGCMELTLEISCCKYPSRSELNKLWNDNREALLIYAREAHKGVKGVVRDERFGGPINGAQLMILGRDMYFNTTSRGEYWRLLLPRRDTYRIEVQADGYHKQVIPFQISASQTGATWLEITMKRRQEVNKPDGEINATRGNVETSDGEESHTENVPITNTTQLLEDENASQTQQNTGNKSLPINNELLMSSATDLDNRNLTDLLSIRTQKSIQNAMVSAGWMHQVRAPAGLSVLLFLIRIFY